MTPVSPIEFQAATQRRQSWHVVVPNDTPLEDLLKPAFWVNCAGRCTPHAIIDVMTNDGTLDVQLRVVKISNGIMTVRPRFIWEDKEARAHLAARAEVIAAADDPERKAPDGYKVGFNPGKKLFYVQLKATGMKVKEDFTTRIEAIIFAEQHAAVLNTPSKAA